MTPLFKKINYKDQRTILIINPPESFSAELEAMSASLTEQQMDVTIITNHSLLKKIGFTVIFVTKKAEINTIIGDIAPKLEGDAVLWFAYPKGSSKKYMCDFNRDTGWEKLGEYNLEPVRQVAIDQDWSALRFRNIDYIKKLKRREGFALSEKGKMRTQGNTGK